MRIDPDSVLLFIMVVLGVNHLLFRFPGWEERRALFWAAQSVNILAAVAMILFIPAIRSDAPMLNWVVGLLLAYHVLTNHFRLQRAVRAREHRERMAEARRQQQASAAEDAPPPEDPPQPSG